MINWLYIYLINNNKNICGASYWRRTLWLGLRLGASVSRGIAPLPRAPFVTRGLDVRTLGACPVTCSSRHLTSHLFHSYISTIYSLRPRGFAFFSFLCVLGQYRLRAWALKKTKELLVSLDAIRVGSHIQYLILKNSIWSTSFWLIQF